MFLYTWIVTYIAFNSSVLQQIIERATLLMLLKSRINRNNYKLTQMALTRQETTQTTNSIYIRHSNLFVWGLFVFFVHASNLLASLVSWVTMLLTTVVNLLVIAPQYFHNATMNTDILVSNSWVYYDNTFINISACGTIVIQNAGHFKREQLSNTVKGKERKENQEKLKYFSVQTMPFRVNQILKVQRNLFLYTK